MKDHRYSVICDPKQRNVNCKNICAERGKIMIHLIIDHSNVTTKRDNDAKITKNGRLLCLRKIPNCGAFC